MIPIPKGIRAQLEREAPTAVCARINDGVCAGRLTVEHAFGRQQPARWNLLWLCYFHHLDKGLDKQKNRWLTLNQGTDKDFNEFPKSAQFWKQEKIYLNTVYGKATIMEGKYL